MPNQDLFFLVFGVKQLARGLLFWQMCRHFAKGGKSIHDFAAKDELFSLSSHLVLGDSRHFTKSKLIMVCRTIMNPMHDEDLVVENLFSTTFVIIREIRRVKQLFRPLSSRIRA